MNRRLWILAVLFACVALSACTEEQNDPTAEVVTVRSEQQRELSPNASDAEMLELSAGNNAFAFDFYHQLASSEGNLFYSPYSISLALSMTWAGAAGNTASQMAEVLNFTLTEDRHHNAFNQLDLALESRGAGAQGADGGGFRLKITNALWGQQGYAFEMPFLDTLGLNYGAGMTVLDFANEPDPSRLIINDWVAAQTEDRIKDLLPEGSIHELTRLVLTNAIYFNAAWATPFEKDNTAAAPFTTPSGPVNVEMMNQTEYFSFYQGNGYMAAALPYDGDELEMLVVLPEEGSFATVEGSLSSALLDEIVAGRSSQRLDVALPKFRIEGESIKLNDQLKAMGMTDAFEGALADFSRMLSPEIDSLYIGGVIHKAFVEVTEAGTEAAAATAVILDGRTSIEPDPISFHADRPFMFLIRDRETNAVLFVGRVLDPR
ncbi:MAG: serpin family protein [Myxococcota bacterium]|jgi:serpin B|nr:serpin family protein [Myxococcota bacterium]